MSLFVAVGHQGQRVASENGADWKNLQLGKEGEIYRAVASGNSIHVAAGNFGGANLLSATRDGVTWDTANKDGQYKNFIRGMAFGNGGFLAIGGDPGAVGSSAPFIVQSADGVQWGDYVPIAGRHILRRVAWGGGRWVGVGDRGRRAASKDGKEWTDAPSTKAADTLVDVTFGAGKFVGVGLHGLRSVTEDGLQWPHRFPGEEGEHINSVLWTGDRFVAVGQGATYFSPDGLEWTRKENKDAPLAAAFGAGAFVGTHWKGRILGSDDAIEWRQVYKCEHHLEAVSFG
jgi:hypothetical protein